jgi:nicotinate-nucleotide pyrophosphorylase (carboxylating)
MNLDREILEPFILNAIAEDIGDGDHTSLSTIPAGQLGKAKLLIKDSGILAGIAVALEIFKTIDSKLSVEVLINDGQTVNYDPALF